MITTEQLQAIFAKTRPQADLYFDPLITAMDLFGIDNPRRIAAFLAQVGHESGGLLRVYENLNYSAERLLAVFPKYFTAATAPAYARKPQAIANRVYANRNGNAGEAFGDGYAFRGRGLIQITGRDNYTDCGRALGVNLTADPDLLLESRYAALSAAWFWAAHGCNELADAGMFDAITQRINGGQNGAAERRALWVTAKTVLGVQP